MRLWTSATADARVAGGTPVGHLVASLAWHDADGTNDTPLVDDLAELTALTVVGPETVDGETLMHVRPGPGVKVDQQGWGPRDPSVTDYEIELDLWIQADGTLVKLVQTEQWKVPSGSSTAAVTATATETLSPLAASAEISAPADAWVANASGAMGYTLSQPAGYEVTSGEADDAYVAGEQVLIAVASSQVDAEATLDDMLLALASSYKEQVDAELLMAYDARVDGNPAKIAVFKAKDASGTELRLIDAVIVVDGTLWEVYRLGVPDTVEADVDHVNQSLTTFEFAS